MQSEDIIWTLHTIFIWLASVLFIKALHIVPTLNPSTPNSAIMNKKSVLSAYKFYKNFFDTVGPSAVDAFVAE